MLRFELSNGTGLEIRLDLVKQQLLLVQVWPTGEKATLTIPLPDVKRIAEQVRGLVRYFV